MQQNNLYTILMGLVLEVGFVTVLRVLEEIAHNMNQHGLAERIHVAWMNTREGL